MNMQETKDISPYKQGLRDKIITSAMMAFAKKGIRQVKMDDVASELGISKRTLYEIFDKKEDLLYEGVKYYLGERRSQMQQKAQDCNNVMEIILVAYKLKVEEVRQTNPLFYSEVQKYPKVKKYIANRNEENRSKSIAFLTRGVNEGYFRSDVNYEIINLMTEVFMKHVMDTELYRTYPLTTIFKDFFVTILRGVCTQQGIALIDNFKIRG